MSWGDLCPDPETFIPPPLPSAHSVTSWVTLLLGYPIFLVGGILCQGWGALKAMFPEAELERWGGGKFRGETDSPGFAHQGLDTKSLVVGFSNPSLG